MTTQIILFFALSNNCKLDAGHITIISNSLFLRIGPFLCQERPLLKSQKQRKHKYGKKQGPEAVEEYRFVGKSLTRVDAKDKVTGKAIYVDDLKLPGMLYGKVLRSKYPHTRILSIDTSQAKNYLG